MSHNNLEPISKSLSFSDLSFNLIQDVPRPILRYYSGILPATKQARHLLSVVKLTGWASPEFDPKILDLIYKKTPEATHDICCLYKKEKSNKIRLLFNFQINTNDINAQEVVRFLAQSMINYQGENAKYLLEKRYDKFWREFSFVKLLSIDRLAELV